MNHMGHMKSIVKLDLKLQRKGHIYVIIMMYIYILKKEL